jgi:hypothetical protein
MDRKGRMGRSLRRDPFASLIPILRSYNPNTLNSVRRLR